MSRSPIIRNSGGSSRETLPRYFQGPGSIGMSVTGGLDTRMIMAWRTASPGSIPCYSFGGTYRDSQDVLLGKRLARAWGQTHETNGSRAGFPLAISRLRATHRVPHRRIRGCRFLARPIHERTGPQHRTDQDDRQLRRRGPSRQSDVQARRATDGFVLFGIEAAYRSDPQHLRPLDRVAPSQLYLVVPGSLVPLRTVCPRGDSIVREISVPGQRHCPNGLPRSQGCLCRRVSACG